MTCELNGSQIKSIISPLLLKTSHNLVYKWWTCQKIYFRFFFYWLFFISKMKRSDAINILWILIFDFAKAQFNVTSQLPNPILGIKQSEKYSWIFSDIATGTFIGSDLNAFSSFEQLTAIDSDASLWTADLELKTIRKYAPSNFRWFTSLLPCSHSQSFANIWRNPSGPVNKQQNYTTKYPKF